MANQLDVINAKLDVVIKMSRVIMQWQVKFAPAWLASAQISDSDRKTYSDMISEVEKKLRELDQTMEHPPSF